MHRWVVEQTFALSHWFRRLRIRWEIRDDIHEAFLRLACGIIGFRRPVKLCPPVDLGGGGPAPLVLDPDAGHPRVGSQLPGDPAIVRPVLITRWAASTLYSAV
jgi:hypothetical protein